MKKFLVFSLVFVLLSSACPVSAQTNQHVFVVAGQSNAVRAYPYVAQAAKDAGLENVTVVNCALGWSAIYDWQRTEYLYRMCIDFVNGRKVDAIFWHQGETDARLDIQGGYKSWRKLFLRMVRNFRADLHQPDLPVIAMRLGPHLNPAFFVNVDKVRGLQYSLIRRPFPGVKMLLAEDLPLSADRVHYAEKELKIIAQRWVGAYLEMEGR